MKEASDYVTPSLNLTFKLLKLTQRKSMALFKRLKRSSSNMEAKNLLWIFMLLGVVIMYGSYGIFVDLCKVDGEIPFLTASPVLVTEILKLLICLLILIMECKANSAQALSLNVILPFGIPAFCYAINNNLAVFMQSQMDPATYMVLGNLKIMTTSVLYKIIIKKKLSNVQWMSIGLLTCGGILNSTAALKSKSISRSEIHITFLGLGTLLCYCFISGFAGVFTEYILKNNLELSIFYQNVLLYMFGVIFNFICWVLQAFHKSKDTHENYFSLFHGYSLFTWAVVVTQAFTGIIFSLIMKYNTNIVRLFIIAAAPLVTTALTYYLFDLQIHGEFVVSAFFILSATIVYNLHKNEELKS